MSNFFLVRFSGEKEEEEEHLYALNETAYNFLLDKYKINNTNEIITIFPGSSGDLEDFEIIIVGGSPPPPPPGGGAVRMIMVKIPVQSIVDPNVKLIVLAQDVARLLIDKVDAKKEAAANDAKEEAAANIENLLIKFIKTNLKKGGKKIGLRRRSSSSRRRRSTKRRTTSRKQQKRRRGSRRAH